MIKLEDWINLMQTRHEKALMLNKGRAYKKRKTVVVLSNVVPRYLNVNKGCEKVLLFSSESGEAVAVRRDVRQGEKLAGDREGLPENHVGRDTRSPSVGEVHMPRRPRESSFPVRPGAAGHHVRHTVVHSHRAVVDLAKLTVSYVGEEAVVTEKLCPKERYPREAEAGCLNGYGTVTVRKDLASVVGDELDLVGGMGAAPVV